MNERIKELAERAIRQVCTERTVKGQIERVWCPARYDQVFAELIVKECITLIEPSQEHRNNDSWGYVAGEEGVQLIDSLVVKIEKHFGVK